MFLVFMGATSARVLRKVKLSASVRWLTDFCPRVGRASLEGHQGIFVLSGNL